MHSNAATSIPQQNAIAPLRAMRDHVTHDGATVTIPASAIAAIDAIQRAVAVANARVVAITSPRAGIATSAICAMLAHNVSNGGIKTLLIDASTPSPDDAETGSWLPGEPMADHHLHNNRATGYDSLVVQATPATRPLFNNLPRLQNALKKDFAAYGLIIVDLPPVLETHSRMINPVSFARAADSVFLACATGLTNIGDASAAAELLKEANVELTGTIMDDTAANPPGPEIAALIERTRLLPAGVRARLANWLRTSELFNV